MKVVPLENPTALPPIQMKSPKKRAQRNDTTPWAIEGARKCIGRDPNASVARRNSRTRFDSGPGKHRGFGRTTKKFTEPVALSSTSPMNLRLPPTAPGSGFDLLALRARCKRELTAPAAAPQEHGEGRARNLRKLLRAQRELAVRAPCSKGCEQDSPSRWRFRPPLP